MKQFVKTFEDDDGTIHIWKYDLDVFNRGPIETTVNYSKEFLSGEGEQKTNKTEQKYLNPNNGKYVGYSRAKTLGIVELFNDLSNGK